VGVNPVDWKVRHVMESDVHVFLYIAATGSIAQAGGFYRLG
jgi:hypothetical protein